MRSFALWVFKGYVWLVFGAFNVSADGLIWIAEKTRLAKHASRFAQF